MEPHNPGQTENSSAANKINVGVSSDRFLVPEGFEEHEERVARVVEDEQLYGPVGEVLEGSGMLSLDVKLQVVKKLAAQRGKKQLVGRLAKVITEKEEEFTEVSDIKALFELEALQMLEGDDGDGELSPAQQREFDEEMKDPTGLSTDSDSEEDDLPSSLPSLDPSDEWRDFARIQQQQLEASSPSFSRKETHKRSDKFAKGR